MMHKQLDDFFGLKPETASSQNNKESIRETLGKKLSFWSRLRLLPKVLSWKERYLVGSFLLIATGSFLAIPVTSFYHYTRAQPDYGGAFVEGILGEPRLINPLLATASDADRDLVDLIYSGLLKHNADGKLVPDLARSYEISSDGLTYTVFLKENALWHDGKRVTADDVLFTIQTAQNPDYASPQRVSWQGVEVEKVNDLTIMFKLKNKYAQFLNNLTLGILPRHLWQEVRPINFTLSELNLKPVGSGYYKFDKFKKDRLGRIASYELSAYKKHHNGQPFIDRIELKFYNSEDEMIDAYNRSEIESLGFVSAQNVKKIKFSRRLDVHQLKLPRYFGVFFNQNKSKVLSEKNVRLALSHATDKESILKNILDENGMAVQSPMIGGILDISPSVPTYSYDRERAKTILATSGWSADSAGVLSKNKERLSVKLTTSTWPELVSVAQLLKEQWGAIGVDATVESLPFSQLQQVIKERDYQALLFGEILSVDPDPFSLWHSSQKRDPGLNLALYDNASADTLLEEARQTLNPLERMKKYDDFQKILIEDIPAAFLYSPYYLYAQTKDIQGFATSLISMPSDRFSNIEQWYVETRRTWAK